MKNTSAHTYKAGDTTPFVDSFSYLAVQFGENPIIRPKKLQRNSNAEDGIIYYFCALFGDIKSPVP